MEMEKLHKSNLIIVWIGIAAMTALSLLAARESGFGALNGVIVLVIAGIISTSGMSFCAGEEGGAGKDAAWFGTATSGCSLL